MAQYEGRVVKLMEFGSVVDALHFAMDIQGATVNRNAAVPDDQRVTYRIGINIGDDQRIVLDGRSCRLSAIIDALLAQQARSSRIYFKKIAAFDHFDQSSAIAPVPAYQLAKKCSSTTPRACTSSQTRRTARTPFSMISVSSRSR